MAQGKLMELRSYQHGEGRTGIGQFVEFSCPSGSIEMVREFLATNVRTIRPPTTGRVIAQGGFGSCTRYEVVQYDYAGGGSGYIEVLEIKNPPDGRWGIVINEHTRHRPSAFTEWETLENARSAWEANWGSGNTENVFPTLTGFKRRIVCGELTPWFYAIGDEQLVGDYAFPDGLQDDAVFRFGKQFIVTDYDGVLTVKTCMGTRFVKREDRSFPYTKGQYRLVYWSDGSMWDEGSNRITPRPLEDDEMWIIEAIRQFQKMLAGKSTEFSINFTNGNKFVGKMVPENRRVLRVEGRYDLVVHLKNEKSLQGWTDFKPTKDFPDIVQFVTKKYAEKGKEVERVEVKGCKAVKGGQKWSGVFFHPSH